jgi:hypothetical protein
MGSERKTAMVSVRMPETLVARADFVANNLTTAPRNRSLLLTAALEAWLPSQEQELERLGVIPKKAV